MQQFTQAGTWAGTLGGSLLAITGVIYASYTDPAAFSETVTTGPFTTAAAVGLLGSMLIGWGVIALHLRQTHRTGTFGLVAAAVALGSMMLLTAYYFTDLFVAPLLADIAPAVLNGQGDMGRLGLGMLLVWSFPIVGLTLLGIATLRAKVLPRWAAIALIVAGPVNLIPISGTQILTAAALTVTFYASTRHTTEKMPIAVPAAT